MTKKIFLVEDWDCNYKAFDTLKGAIKYAKKTIDSSNNNSDVEKRNMYGEIIDSLADDNSTGFTIDEFLWCWAIDLDVAETNF